MELIGLFGEHLSHSYSAVIHEELYRRIEKVASYKLLELEPTEVESATKALKLLQYTGVNVTIPYKETVIPFMDHLDKSVALTKAVNTIKVDGDQLRAYNTDYFGFHRLLVTNNLLPTEQDTVLILGYGGASKAIIALLKDLKVKKIVVSHFANTLSNYEDPDIDFISYEEAATYKANLVINTTPVGMYPNLIGQRILPSAALHNFEAAIDVVYNPTETAFIQDAKNAGIPTANGLEMLVNQALKSAEIWFDMEFPDFLYQEINQYMLAYIQNQ